MYQIGIGVHRGRTNLEQHDIGLYGDGLYRIRTRRYLRHDAGAFHFRTAGVADDDGNLFFDRRLNRIRMKHLCTPARHFRRLCVRDCLKKIYGGKQTRIAGEHAVDIGPNLDLRSVERGAHDGGSKIGTASAKSHSDSLFGRRDESAHDNHFAGSINGIAEPAIRLRILWSGTSVFAVGDDYSTSIKVG